MGARHWPNIDQAGPGLTAERRLGRRSSSAARPGRWRLPEGGGGRRRGPMEVAAGPTLEAYDVWRGNSLRSDLAKLTSRHGHGGADRRRLLLAGPAVLPDAEDGGVAARGVRGSNKRLRWRRLKLAAAPSTDPDTGAVRRPKGTPPRRFVCDQFAAAPAIDGVLAVAQQTDWFKSQHTFESVPFRSFAEDVADTAVGAAAVSWIQQLRDEARACVCEALQVDVTLYHAHATLTRTRSTTPAVVSTPQADEAEWLALLSAVELKEAGNAQYRNGMYEPAIDMYTSALAQLPEHMRTSHPEVVLILSNRAACHNQLQDYRQVISDSSAALEIEPTNVKALMRRGFAYEAIERYAPALSDMETVGRLAPRATDAIRAAGRLRGLVKAWVKILAEEEVESGGPVAKPPSLDSWESVNETDRIAQQTAAREKRPETGGAVDEQFTGPHSDMASVLHYDYSAVLYLTSSADGIQNGEFCITNDGLFLLKMMEFALEW